MVRAQLNYLTRLPYTGIMAHDSYNNQVNQMARKLIKTKEAAEKLAVSKQTVVRMAEHGKLEGVRLGARSYRIYEDSVESFLASSRIQVSNG